MLKTQLSGMQLIAGIARQRQRIRRRQTTNRIQRVTQQRMAGCCQMNPDLVRPAGADGHIAQAAAVTTLQHRHPGQGRLAALAGRMD